MLSPGPANLVCLVLASRYGLRQTAWFQMGIVLIYALVGFALAVTATQLGSVFQNAAVFLQVAGGAFIVYLGVRFMVSSPKLGESDSAPTFKSGVLLQMLNPKYPPVVLAILAARSESNNLATVGVVVSVGALGLITYACVGSLVYRWTLDDRYLRWFNIAFGCLLCAVGVWMASGVAGR
ncbi:LysE family translocator [Aeoliella mucimassa]|uniref:Cysteine/O-acetylserine efflux protein n=1 Tax=Aeoliella mucimassa TaxID=2527972 RepID=A0A518AW02_9BACT|nr:LysE family transporter [Aeoliella mucimassa]QDU58888.1 Cysteine/O-acetylserine efflux protein [Aeoliella mucimassa]